MTDVWYRGWEVHDSYFRSSWQAVGPRLLPGESLLRFYFSWHFVGDPHASTEPLFVGVRLMHGQPGSIPTPPDPSDSFGRLTGDWLALETHPPSENRRIEATPWRCFWPYDGHRLWDIKANRKADGEHIIPYLVWSLGANSFGTVAPRFTWSMLKREP